MHDLAAIRRDRDAWAAALARRPAYAATAGGLADDILARDRALRELLTRLQAAQARRNEASKLIGQAKAKKDEAQAAALMAEVAGLKDAIQQGEERAARAGRRRCDDALAVIPNLPAADVPDGADESANVPVAARAFGKPPGDRIPPKQHFEIGEALGQMDFERAAKVSGARFVYLKSGSGAAGARASAQFHAGHAHGRIRLHRSPAAGAGARQRDVRHGAVAEI